MREWISGNNLVDGQVAPHKQQSAGRIERTKQSVHIIVTTRQFTELQDVMDDYEWHGGDVVMLSSLRNLFGDEFVDGLVKAGGYTLIVDVEGEAQPYSDDLPVFDLRPRRAD